MRISIIIPVYNEQRCLADSLSRLHSFLSSKDFTWDSEIVVADNGSTDRTREIASQLARKHDNIRVLHLDQKGRGRTLKHAWLTSEADILSYMDADLSSDLASFPLMVEKLLSGNYDLAIGSRVLQPKLTTRCFRREFTSRVYNLLIRLLFRPSFSDAQCGFKAITREVARALLPQVQDNGWFFDTELLLLAEHHGYRIFDLPVRYGPSAAKHTSKSSAPPSTTSKASSASAAPCDASHVLTLTPPPLLTIRQPQYTRRPAAFPPIPLRDPT